MTREEKINFICHYFNKLSIWAKVVRNWELTPEMFKYWSDQEIDAYVKKVRKHWSY